MSSSSDDRVSRSRYNRERAARAEAETLLEDKSRELFEANATLNAHSERLQQAVDERTEELQRALERAEASSLARSRFIATMSHEIRTPLGGLLGMIDLLTLNETDPEKLDLLHYARSAGSGLSRIVNDVLDFSKMEAGVFIFKEEHVDIRALVKSIAMLQTSSGRGAERTITMQIDESVPKLFLSDATRIRQVISNLISNALRYSAQGPIVVRAIASPHPKGALLRCEVEDSGVGIPREKLGDLFKDFSQVSNPLTVAAQGTGLGLAICKRIMAGLGGTMGVDSTHGEGSTFWFELAIECVERAQEDPLDDHPTQAPVSVEGKHILIAEDNVINQRMLLAYAKNMKLSADLAENGRIAVEKFKPGKYDAIVMDIAMPEMDGIEAACKIRERWPSDSLPPIIALTAHVTEAIETDAKQVGICEILSKPIPYNDLKSALETILSQAACAKLQAPTAQVIESETPPSDNILFDHISEDAAANLTAIFSTDEIQDLAVKFITDSRRRMKSLLAAHQADDQHTVSQEAHSLKGACFALGFEEMADWAKRIELYSDTNETETIGEISQKFLAKVDALDAIVRPQRMV